MIRASGHHHKGQLPAGLNQAGSLQQLSVGTPTQTPHLTYQSPPPGIAHHQKSTTHSLLLLLLFRALPNLFCLLRTLNEFLIKSYDHWLSVAQHFTGIY